MRRFVATLVGVLVVTLGAAAPASAHTKLNTTDPMSGAVYAASPPRVTVTFTAAVTVSPDSIRVFDSAATAVATNTPARAGQGGLQASLELPPLDNGIYAVRWRVLSADSHPLIGTFTFEVGQALTKADRHDLVAQVNATEAGSSAVSAANGIARFLTLTALIVLVGGAAFLLALWPGGRSRSRRVIGIAWMVTALATAGGIAAQGVYAAGRPLGDLFDVSLIGGVLDTRFGQTALARLALLLVGAPLLVSALRAERRRPLVTGGLGVIAVGLLVTLGLAGHPGADSPAAVSVAVDAVHLGAVSFWLGGLALMATVTLSKRGRDEDIEVVGRFSKAAAIAVGVIVVTGSYQGWRQAGGFPAVTGTAYGRLLLTKLALFGGMLVLAWFSRAWLRRRALASASGEGVVSMPSLAGLRRTVAGEAFIAVVVLVVTAVLVTTSPA